MFQDCFTKDGHTHVFYYESNRGFLESVLERASVTGEETRYNYFDALVIALHVLGRYHPTSLLQPEGMEDLKLVFPVAAKILERATLSYTSCHISLCLKIAEDTGLTEFTSDDLRKMGYDPAALERLDDINGKRKIYYSRRVQFLREDKRCFKSVFC